jgi:hypothetical protein
MSILKCRVSYIGKYLKFWKGDVITIRRFGIGGVISGTVRQSKMIARSLLLTLGKVISYILTLKLANTAEFKEEIIILLGFDYKRYYVFPEKTTLSNSLRNKL